MKIKELALKGVAKAAEKAISNVAGERCTGIIFEAEVPAKLKAQKLKK